MCRNRYQSSSGLKLLFINENTSDEDIEKFISEFKENFVVEDDDSGSEKDKYEKITLGETEINF